MCNVVNRRVAEAAHILNLKITEKSKAVPRMVSMMAIEASHCLPTVAILQFPLTYVNQLKVHVTSKNHNAVTFINILVKVMAMKMEEISYFLKYHTQFISMQCTQNLGCAAISQQGWEQTMACSFPLLS